MRLESCGQETEDDMLGLMKLRLYFLLLEEY